MHRYQVSYNTISRLGNAGMVDMQYIPQLGGPRGAGGCVDLSQTGLDTKDVFIECTATDLTKANVVLNTMVAMFSEYCKTPFQVEPLERAYADDNPGNTE